TIQVCAISNYVEYGYAAGRFAVPAEQSYGGILPATVAVQAGVSGDAVIGNPIIKLTTSSQFAGAINGLYYGGKQFVTNPDHGQSIQIASFNYGLGGCNNPTEAGSQDDGTNATSTSVVQGIYADASSLSTLVSPAYWLRPSDA